MARVIPSRTPLMLNVCKVLIACLVSLAVVVSVMVAIIAFEPYGVLRKETVSGDSISRETNYRPFWSIQAMVDRGASALDRLLNPGHVPFPYGVESSSFQEHLDAVQLKTPVWSGEALYELEAGTAEGPMYPAFCVYHWHSDSSPTLIFHHGAFEYPFDRTFKRIFNQKTLSRPLEVNLIVVRTAFHRESGRELVQGVESVSKFLAVMAVSVKLTEDLIQIAKAKGVTKTSVTGLSLGGMIANRHHVEYNSASCYIPVTAGTAHELLFLPRSSADSAEEQRNAVIRSHLNFTAEWMTVENNNVFPIMARYDGYCRLEEQGISYGNCVLEVWNRCHLTTGLSFRALREAFLYHLEAE